MILSLPNAQAECRVTLKGAPPRARMEVLGELGHRSSTVAPTGAFGRGGDGERCAFQHNCNKNSKVLCDNSLLVPLTILRRRVAAWVVAAAAAKGLP